MLSEKINFSSFCNPNTNANIAGTRQSWGYYRNLLADTVDMNNFSEQEIDATVNVMGNHASADISTDHYYFWIDD